jgi:hypothetical protein
MATTCNDLAGLTVCRRRADATSEEGARMRKPWGVVAAVVAVLIIGASTVAAAKPPSGTGRQVVERTVTLEPPSGSDILDVNELVTCPAGTASVNGGWAWVTPPPNEGTHRRVNGGPEGADWRVVFTVLVEPGPHTFAFWAICVNA